MAIEEIVLHTNTEWLFFLFMQNTFIKVFRNIDALKDSKLYLGMYRIATKWSLHDLFFKIQIAKKLKVSNEQL